LAAGYAFSQLQLHAKGPRVSEQDEGLTPRHAAFLQAWTQVGRGVELGLGLRYVDDLPAAGIDAYLEMDARVSWRPWPAWELSVVGRNLLEASHPEFPALPGFPQSEVERSVAARCTFRF
jgi:iron complex outermembrane receptor protein